MNNTDPSIAPLDSLVLSRYPYPMAVAYRKVIEAGDARTRVDSALWAFQLGMRTITVAIISQYLMRDASEIHDPYLAYLFDEKFPRPSYGVWKDILFTLLKAYKEKRERFFIKELYDLYWDVSHDPHIPHPHVQDPYNSLLQVRNDLAHDELSPNSAGEWEQLAGKVVQDLQRVMRQFQFIQNYSLIRVVERHGDDYAYVDYTGEHLTTSLTLMRSDEALQPGQFYLVRADRQLLQLHPLLIFWEETPASLPAMERRSDAAIYNRLGETTVRYIKMVLRGGIRDKSLVAELARLLSDTLSKLRELQVEEKRLTWPVLRKAAAEISDERFGSARAKYDAKVYLQREEVKRAFDDFIDSDKTAFVLLGKSGVGKSNFFLSLAQEYQAKAQDRVCPFLYNGSRLETDAPLIDVLARDIESQVHLVKQSGEEGIQDLLTELTEIGDIEQRIVIVFIDALNESTDANKLLGLIDALVASNPPRWFKVVLSSRPEAWRRMEHAVPLTESKYYRRPGQAELGLELQPFAFTVELKSFGQDELQRAFEKYRKVHNLKTPYEEVGAELRRLLNDPLTLKLTAEAYAGERLPEAFHPGEIYRRYIDRLIYNSRLRSQDVRFLERQLMPLMMNGEELTNKVTSGQVDDSDALFDEIDNEERLSNGEQRNQSYTNLVNAEILMKQGSPRTYEIVFKYERFYDYFGGMQLYNLAKTQTDRLAFFQKTIEMTAQRYYLWGPVKNALVQDAKENGPDLSLKLCFSSADRVREMMVDALIDVGRDDAKRAEEILKALFPTEPPSRLHNLQRLVRRQPVRTATPELNAKKTAIEVASELNMTWVLEAAGMLDDPNLRTASARAAYHMWQRDRQPGFQVLQYWARNVLDGLIPNLAAFESLLGLSLIIFFDHPRDREVLGRMQEVWREVIARVFGIQSSSSRAGKAIRDRLRETIFGFAITVFFRLFKEMPSYTIVNYPDFQAFFKSSAEDKAFYRRLTRYIDMDGDYTREQLEADLLRVPSMRNLLIEGAAVFVLNAHTFRSPSGFLPVLTRFFEQARHEPLANPYLGTVPQIAASVLDHDPNNDEMYDLFIRTVEVCQEYYAEHRTFPGLTRVTHSARAMYFGPCLLYQYQRTGTVRTEWFESRIKQAFDLADSDFFKTALETELPLVGIEMRGPRIALEALSMFLKYPIFEEKWAQVLKMVRGFLSRLRVYYPLEVDEFLEDQKLPQEFRLEVRTNEPPETVGGLIGIRSYQFIRDDVVAGPPDLRDRLIRVLEAAADAASAKAWIDYALREVINLIYGGEALRRVSQTQA